MICIVSDGIVYLPSLAWNDSKDKCGKIGNNVIASSTHVKWI